MLLTPTFADTEKQQELLHTVGADPWNAEQ